MKTPTVSTYLSGLAAGLFIAGMLIRFSPNVTLNRLMAFGVVFIVLGLSLMVLTKIKIESEE